MMTVNIKIELNNLDKAMTEIKALENTVLHLAKTYPTAFTQEVVEAPKEAVKKPRKPRVTKPKEEVVVEEAPSEEVVVEVEKTTVKTGEEGRISLDELTKLGQKLVKDGFRAEAKALISKYSTSGKLSSVPEDKYTELAKALSAL